MSELPTQADILELWLRVRDCPHQWRYAGADRLPDGDYCVERCEWCGRERTERIRSLTHNAPASQR